MLGRSALQKVYLCFGLFFPLLHVKLNSCMYHIM